MQERAGYHSRAVPFRQAARPANGAEDAAPQPHHTPAAAHLGHAALRHAGPVFINILTSGHDGVSTVVLVGIRDSLGAGSAFSLAF